MTSFTECKRHAFFDYCVSGITPPAVESGQRVAFGTFVAMSSIVAFRGGLHVGRNDLLNRMSYAFFRFLRRCATNVHEHVVSPMATAEMAAMPRRVMSFQNIMMIFQTFRLPIFIVRQNIFFFARGQQMMICSQRFLEVDEASNVTQR